MDLFAQVVYILCAATSILCAAMLGRGYYRTGARLLLWSSLCFIFLSINNILLFVDKVLLPDVPQPDLMGVSYSVLRSIAALAGVALLLFGLIWDSR